MGRVEGGEGEVCGESRVGGESGECVERAECVGVECVEREVECVECAVLQYWQQEERKCAECEWCERYGVDRVPASCEPARERCGEMHWMRCELGQLQFFSVLGHAVQPAGLLAGVPTAAVPERLWKGWSGPRQGASHPNMRFMEALDFCGQRADPATIVHRTTEVCPAMWYQSAQQQRLLRVLGSVPPPQQGPRPNFDVQLPDTMEGLFEPSKLQQTYLRRCRQRRQLCVQLERASRGMRVQWNEVEGGRDGVEYGPDARKEQFRHLVFRNSGGRPVVVREGLPDERSDMNLERWFRLAVDSGSSDLGIVSEIALYGLVSRTAVTPTTCSWPLYAGGYRHISFLQRNRDKQRSDYASARVSEPCIEPLFEPERSHPKSVVVVTKEDGTVKEREVTDYAATRQQADASWSRMRVRLLRSRLRADDVARHLRAKGKPGENSFNARVQAEWVGDVVWGDVKLLAEAADVLMASGLPVDAKSDDFEAFFPQMALPEFELWLHTQLIDSRGGEINFRSDFGASHLPPKTSRANYNVTEIIDAKIWELQQQRQWALQPWSREMVAAADAFEQARRRLGESGRFWYSFGWIDDNSFVSLRVLTVLATQVRYAVWEEIVWVWDKKKSTQYLFGELHVPPIVGVELRLHERRIELPAAKKDKYGRQVQKICAAAEIHPRSLVSSEELDKSLGQLIHAADVYFEMWLHFMELLGSLSSGRSLVTHTAVGKAARHHLREMVRVMTTADGRPSTSYCLRPGQDGLPVFCTWSDAARNTRTFAGGIGGYFHAWDCDVVFFFAESLPVWLVQAADVTQLEMHAATVAAHLQQMVYGQLAREADPQSYLIQYGDSQSVFRHVLNTMRGRSPGMRPLAAARWRMERRNPRLVCGVWIPRESNKAADALANVDIAAFVQHMRRRYPASLCLCRLAVPTEVLISDDLRVAVRRGGSQAAA